MINVSDVTDLLNVSSQTVLSQNQGWPPESVQIGRKWRFSRHEIEGMLTARERSVPLSLAAGKCEGLSERDQAIIERHPEELRCKEQGKNNR